MAATNLVGWKSSPALVSALGPSRFLPRSSCLCILDAYRLMSIGLNSRLTQDNP
jgi:hypothetical protein